MAQSRAIFARMPSSKTLRETATEQVRALRTNRGMSQQGLADRLNGLGARIDRTAVAKIETGKRELGIAEAFMFALALDVAPVHLFVPVDSQDAIQLAPNMSAEPHEVRAWMRGFMPLFQDPRVYFSRVPRSEFKAAEDALSAWEQNAPIRVTTEPEN
jgi:transcriptional regulator with XRE-family HTH domain